METGLPDRIVIGDECPQDIPGIRRVNLAAFDGEYEADVVDQLRLNCPSILSMVARHESNIIGHILFSPVRIVQSSGLPVEGMGLGPLAVHPDHQRRGFGSALSRAGLERMKATGQPFVVVLGHPEYYPRFGFREASTYGIKCSFPGVPEEAFMICIFDPGIMGGVSGVAYYRPEFGEET